MGLMVVGVLGREERWEKKSLEMREKQVLEYSWRSGAAKEETLRMVLFISIGYLVV